MKIAVAILFFVGLIGLSGGQENPSSSHAVPRLLAWRSAGRRRHLLCPISSAINNPTRRSKGQRALFSFSFVPPIGDPSAKRSSCSCKTQNKDLRRKD